MRSINSKELLADYPLDYFSSLSVFGALSPEAVTWLLQHGRILRLDEGETLFLQGDTVDEFYIVLAGHLSSYRPLKDRLVLTRECTPGEHVGFTGMIALHDRYGTAIAKQESVLLEISSSQFHRMHETLPQQFGIFLLNLTRELARNVGSLGDKITILSETPDS